MKIHIALVGMACNMAMLSHDVIADDININGFFSAGAGIASFETVTAHYVAMKIMSLSIKKPF